MTIAAAKTVHDGTALVTEVDNDGTVELTWTPTSGPFEHISYFVERRSKDNTISWVIFFLKDGKDALAFKRARFGAASGESLGVVWKVGNRSLNIADSWLSIR